MTQLGHLVGVLGIIFPWGQENVFQHEILVCFVLITVWIAWAIWVWRRDLFALSAYLVAAFSGLLVFAASGLYGYGSNLGVVFDSVSSQAVLFLTGLTVFFTFSNDKPMRAILVGFRAVCVINSVAIIGKHFLGLPPYFILSNPAMDASLIATTFPLVCFQPGYCPYIDKKIDWSWVKFYWFSFLFDTVCLITPLVAILLTGSTTGICAFVVASAAYVVAARRRVRLLDVVLVGIALKLASLFIGSSEFINDAGRFGIWKVVMNFWWKEFAPFGAGLGTFQVFGPMIQLKENYQIGNYFIWLHNDWLQVLFETGLIGLLSVVILFVAMLWRTFRKPWLFSAIATYGFIGMTQMPLRVAPLAVFGCLLVRLSLKKL